MKSSDQVISIRREVSISKWLFLRKQSPDSSEGLEIPDVQGIVRQGEHQVMSEVGFDPKDLSLVLLQGFY